MSWDNGAPGSIDWSPKERSNPPIRSMDEGKIVTWKKGQTVADGPFAESKEAIGGYFLLEMNDLDEALGNCQGMPDPEIRGDGRGPAGGRAVRVICRKSSALAEATS